MLSALFLVLACSVPALAQWETPKLPTINLKHKHFVFFKCDGQPDKVFGRRDEVYFGCINGEVRCTHDGITQSMADQYERDRESLIRGADRRKREISSRSGRSSSARSSRRTPTNFTVKSKPRPPAQTAPIEADKVRQVAIGSSSAEVISALGQPKWKIAGGNGSWTYSLVSGGSAKLMFDGGKVARVVVP